MAWINERINQDYGRLEVAMFPNHESPGERHIRLVCLQQLHRLLNNKWEEAETELEKQGFIYHDLDTSNGNVTLNLRCHVNGDLRKFPGQGHTLQAAVADALAEVIGELTKVIARRRISKGLRLADALI